MLRQARHERGGVVHMLRCHPATPPRSVTAVSCEWCATDEDEILLIFTVDGAKTLVVPEEVTPGRADELWRTTCFEMFWKPCDREDYVELNLSPSGQWAAYAFSGYRAGMCDQPMAVGPHVETRRSGDRLIAEIDVDLATFPMGAASVGLSAVIEERDGTKSYWALAHPDSRPDFHDPDCFTLSLPAS